MNRRQFMKNGGLLMTGALFSPSILSSCAGPTSSNPAEGVKFALNHFGITESDMQKVLQAALSKGGDYADLFFEHTFNNHLSLQDNKVNGGGSSIDFGVGIRVVEGDQTGYAFVENISLDEMVEAAKLAALVATSPNATTQAINISKNNHKEFLAIPDEWEKKSIQEKIPYLNSLNDKIFAKDPRVKKVRASFSDQTSHILFCNSEGVTYYDYRPMATLGVMCIMEENNRTENGSTARSYRMGSSFLSDDLVNTLADEVVGIASRSFQAIKPKGGEMPVVMGAGGSGILLHEAIGHAFEADFNRKNTSIFSDQLNKKICNEMINVVDDATIPHNRGFLNIDDEGVDGQKTYIVKDGVLNSYLHDRISAKHYGIQSTGNGRRESFRKVPIPRMRATYMEAGNCTEEDIIRSVKKGIFVDHFTNGQVQIGAGDFTFFVKSGYLIEDGKLTQPIKDINIIGNGPKALADITMVANNPLISDSSWTCGKDGQGCPVTCGMPSALVSSLTVGGE